MKRLRIIPAVGLHNNYTASYYPLKHIIYYNKELDKFPKLKKKIITHEKKHADSRLNVLRAAWDDVVDYTWLQFDKEYAAYLRHVDEQTGTVKDFDGNKALFILQIGLYKLIVGIYYCLILIPLVVYRSYLWRRNRKKKSLKNR